MNNKRYLFRGFHPDENGETELAINDEKIRGKWLYWDVLGIILNPITFKREFCESTTFIGQVNIIEETIGQWATTDNNGRDIFEGDIVLTISEKGTPYKHLIIWEDSCQRFAYQNKQVGTSFIYKRETMQVIGNKWKGTE